MELEGPAIPHLAKGEIADLRGDVDRAFERGELFTAKVTVPAAAIKTMAASPIQLAPAAGANTMLEFVSASLRLVSGSEVLTEAANLQVKYTDGSGVAVSEAIEMTGFLDAAANARTNARAAADAIVAADAAVDAALVLHNLGAEYGGNASDDASLEVYVSYKVHKNVG
jgi:hypothetical protein